MNGREMGEEINVRRRGKKVVNEKPSRQVINYHCAQLSTATKMSTTTTRCNEEFFTTSRKMLNCCSSKSDIRLLCKTARRGKQFASKHNNTNFDSNKTKQFVLPLFLFWGATTSFALAVMVASLASGKFIFVVVVLFSSVST